MKPLFDLMKEKLVRAGADLSVTLQALSLGEQNSTTGQYVKGYTPSTIDMLIITQSTEKVDTPAGKHIRIHAIGITDSQVCEGDEIDDAAGVTYLVTGVEKKEVGDQTIHYHCELVTDPLADERVHTYPPPPEIGGIALDIGVATWGAGQIYSIIDIMNERTEGFTGEISTVLASSVGSDVSNTSTITSTMGIAVA